MVSDTGDLNHKGSVICFFLFETSYYVIYESWIFLHSSWMEDCVQTDDIFLFSFFFF